MSDMRAKVFSIGFFGGLILFAVANVYDYYRMKAEPALIDACVSFGMPLKFYVTGCFAGGGILWHRFLADALTAVCVSAVLGWVLARLFPEVAAA